MGKEIVNESKNINTKEKLGEGGLLSATYDGRGDILEVNNSATFCGTLLKKICLLFPLWDGIVIEQENLHCCQGNGHSFHVIVVGNLDGKSTSFPCFFRDIWGDAPQGRKG